MPASKNRHTCCTPMLHVCAWCQQIQDPLTPGFPRRGTAVTHTICASCVSRYFDSTLAMAPRVVIGHAIQAQSVARRTATERAEVITEQD